ncbi:MAG TPA: MlaD family protein [Terriglobia bacterium]|nr:MlaD family protein [Terriglobia bacterium]
MAQRRSLTWTELRVGLLVIVSFGLLVLAIFFIGGESGFLTKKYTVYAYFPSANGLKSGAEVHLEGVTIGNVGCATWMAWRCNPVRISGDPEPSRSVVVEMQLDRRYQDVIRSDSTVTMDTVGLLGDKTIEISRGTERGEPIPDRGELQGKGVAEIKEVIQGANDVIANFNELSRTLREITAKVNRGQGTAGRFLNDESIYEHVDKTVQDANQSVDEISDKITSLLSQVDSLVADAHNGKGTVGRLISDDTLYRNLNDSVTRLSNRVDELIARVEKGEGTAAKFINDPALYNNANKLVENANHMVDTTNTAVDNANQLITQARGMFEHIDRGEGTLGKLYRDEALYAELRSTINRVSTLVDHIENGDGTTGKLIKDPSVYNSLKDTTAEIQKLIYDFRQDPKRYMNIQFKLF